ncbi:MAG: phosphate acetyltransferase [bacterium]
MIFVQDIRERAKRSDKKIVFPEGAEIRIQKAVEYLNKNNILRCILLGNEHEIRGTATQNSVELGDVEILDPRESQHLDEFCDIYYELRKDKDIDREDAQAVMKKPIYFAAMMVRAGLADGSVAGSVSTTGEVLKAAIQIIGMAPGISLVSSTFEMVFQDNRVLTYADCAVVPNPDSEQLADIAISSAKTHWRLTGEEPCVALLSYSTKGSAEHPLVEKVQQAVEIAKSKNPNLKIDGELQGDAALVETVAERKAPGSVVAGKANVLIFPDLNAGNIAYKLTERLASAKAMGPIIQGLDKPAHDLSRGCSWDDIVNVACIGSIMA